MFIIEPSAYEFFYSLVSNYKQVCELRTLGLSVKRYPRTIRIQRICRETKSVFISASGGKGLQVILLYRTKGKRKLRCVYDNFPLRKLARDFRSLYLSNIFTLKHIHFLFYHIFISPFSSLFHVKKKINQILEIIEFLKNWRLINKIFCAVVNLNII